MPEIPEHKRPASRPAQSPEEIAARVTAWVEEMKHASAYSREQYSRILGATLDAIENDHGDITPIEYFLTSLLTKYAEPSHATVRCERDRDRETVEARLHSPAEQLAGLFRS